MSIKQALARIDTEIETTRWNIASLESRLSSLILARSFVEGDAEGEIKRLPAPARKTRKGKPERQAENKPQAAKSTSTSLDTKCPLDWELGGKRVSLALKPALLLRAMLQDGGEEAIIVPQAQLLQVIGTPSAPSFYKELAELRAALAEAKTGTVVEAVRGQGYRLRAEE